MTFLKIFFKEKTVSYSDFEKEVNKFLNDKDITRAELHPLMVEGRLAVAVAYDTAAPKNANGGKRAMPRGIKKKGFGL